MAEDFETLAGVAASALDTPHQWAKEPIEQMVVLHKQALKEHEERIELLQAALERERQAQVALRLAHAERDTLQQRLEDSIAAHVGEVTAHNSTRNHRDQLLAEHGDHHRGIAGLTGSSCFEKGFCSLHAGRRS